MVLMPLEYVEPDSFRVAAKKARLKCRDEATGAWSKTDLALVQRAIVRAKRLVKAHPEIVELLLNRTRTALAEGGH
jgi:hypothetical protein